ncbi:hypothetical protein AGABI1DRAFT_128246 [Agaricus bisporus var. burnettii JB137-S8]|uniref:Uncharacterized protein n=1 Tax=Agaricus bisporus var. burnettii (strain JB137-S8 / ATCC MYA-4627 / FGSC 10392) TaxID=597362 RepID=K5WUI5_AGABU|nr:uncharacterized protein AGABI1DRAFT_128246 [Agaricus bisporus var. burnettii JB137-S8]EKM79081.1 hypothetical protein AGABI1DRAFT_128246 [Agaricus bisporus var. burnettii JB137-S8]
MASQRAMEDDVWHSLPDTTNAQEAAHWATYRAAGTNHSLLAGLEALHAVVAAFKTLDGGAKRGQKSHYGHDRREKRMAREHGRSHPQRDPLANPGRSYINDGRAPDTMAKLVGKKSPEKRQKEATTTINDTFGSIYFSWKDNSCWLDVSLVLLDNAIGRGWEEFNKVCDQVLEEPGLREVLGAMKQIRSLKSSPEQGIDLGSALNVERNSIRASLLDEGIILDMVSPDMVFGWLGSLIRHCNASSRFYSDGFFIPYFLPRYCEIHKCTGCDRTGGPHWEITRYLQNLFTIQVGASQHSEYQGRLTRWFNDFLTPKPIVNLPLILVIEFEQEEVAKPLEWYIPTTLPTQYSYLTKARDLIYELVGVSLVSSSSSGNHFTARFHEDKSVYMYDDMTSGGRAMRVRDGVVNRHVGGHPPKYPSKHAVHHAVYFLKGGLDAQQAFYEARLATIKKDFDITVGTENPTNSTIITYDGKLTRMPSYRRTWIRNERNQNLYDEYVDPVIGHLPVEVDRPVTPLRSLTPLPLESEEPLDKSDKSRGKAVNMDELYNRVHTPDDNDELPTVETLLTVASKNTFPRLSPRVALTPPRAADTNIDNDSLMDEDPDGSVEPTTMGDERDCKRRSHLACQPSGLLPLGRWKCHYCSTLDRPKPSGDVTSRRMLTNVWMVNRKLPDRLRPGVGALCKLGDFHYPVRLLKYDASTKTWDVQWWRGCRFLSGGPHRLPDDITSEPESSIADAHWGEPMARRDIRLGVWTLASTLKEDTLDYMSDVNYMPYTPDIHLALGPAISTLKHIIEAPDTMDASDVPILQKSRGIKVNSFENMVKDAPRGALPMRERAGITNWLYRHLGADARQQTAMCHACTIWIAEKLQTVNWPKPDGSDWIQEAWRIQTNSGRSNLIDINKTCISKLERLMFEFSKNTGKAGDFMWGLNLGDHQDQWDPYKLVPKDWIVNDHEVDSSANDIGWDYIKVLPASNPSNATPGHVPMPDVAGTTMGEVQGVLKSRKRQRSPDNAEPVASTSRGRPRGRPATTKAGGRGGRGGTGRGRGRRGK